MSNNDGEEDDFVEQLSGINLKRALDTSNPKTSVVSKCSRSFENMNATSANREEEYEVTTIKKELLDEELSWSADEHKNNKPMMLLLSVVANFEPSCLEEAKR